LLGICVPVFHIKNSQRWLLLCTSKHSICVIFSMFVFLKCLLILRAVCCMHWTQVSSIELSDLLFLFVVCTNISISRYIYCANSFCISCFFQNFCGHHWILYWLLIYALWMPSFNEIKIQSNSSYMFLIGYMIYADFERQCI